MAEPKTNRSLLLRITDSSKPYLMLGATYQKLIKHHNYPVGSITLADKNGVVCPALVKRYASGYRVGKGWTTVVRKLHIQPNDYIILRTSGEQTFRVEVLKEDQFYPHACATFYEVFQTPANNDFLLPMKYIKHNFTDLILGQYVTIFFDDEAFWKVRVKKVCGGYFFTCGWDLLKRELELEVGEMLVFTKIGKYKFRLDFYDVDGSEVILENSGDVEVKKSEKIIIDLTRDNDTTRLPLAAAIGNGMNEHVPDVIDDVDTEYADNVMEVSDSDGDN